MYKNCGWWKNFDCIFGFSVKSYVRNTINLSCAKILLTSVITQSEYTIFCKNPLSQQLESLGTLLNDVRFSQAINDYYRHKNNEGAVTSTVVYFLGHLVMLHLLQVVQCPVMYQISLQDKYCMSQKFLYQDDRHIPGNF